MRRVRFFHLFIVATFTDEGGVAKPEPISPNPGRFNEASRDDRMLDGCPILHVPGKARHFAVMLDALEVCTCSTRHRTWDQQPNVLKHALYELARTDNFASVTSLVDTGENLRGDGDGTIDHPRNLKPLLAPGDLLLLQRTRDIMPKQILEWLRSHPWPQHCFSPTSARWNTVYSTSILRNCVFDPITFLTLFYGEATPHCQPMMVKGGNFFDNKYEELEEEHVTYGPALEVARSRRIDWAKLGVCATCREALRADCTALKQYCCCHCRWNCTFERRYGYMRHRQGRCMKSVGYFNVSVMS